MALEKVSGIYQVRNLSNGKRYVGSSTHVFLRFRQHQGELKRGSHPSIILQRAWAKYGSDGFAFELIEAVQKASELQSREQYFIDFYQSAKTGVGYNTLPFAYRSFGRPPASLETRARISNARKGKEPWNKGKRGVYSEDTRKRMGDSKVGVRVTFSKEHCSHLRGPKSPDHVDKIRTALKQYYSIRPHLLQGENNPNWGKGRSVEQFNLEGRSLATFHSIQAAARATGFKKCNIALACKGTQATSNGFIWKYAS